MMEEEVESLSDAEVDESGEESDEAHIAKLIQVLEMDSDDMASSSSEDSQGEEFRNKCEILGPTYLLDKHQACVMKSIDGNHATRDALKKAMEYVQTLIDENQAKQRDAKQWAKTNQDTLKHRIGSNSTIRKFGYPYFKDASFFPCPPSADAIERQKRCINISHSDSLNKWQSWEMMLLEKAVQNTALEQLRAPLEVQRQRLCEQLKAEENAGKSTKKTKRLIHDIITQIHNQAGDPLCEMLADENSSIDWMRISAQCFDGKRSASVCNAMWNCCLRSGVSRDSWTVPELNQLLVLSKEHNYCDWDTIAEKLNSGRTAYQCFTQLQTVMNRSRAQWTKEEDHSLKTAVDFYRVGDYIPFDKVIGLLPGRTVAQIRERWQNDVDPTIRIGAFTPREDLVIMLARQTFQMTFSQISSVICGRTVRQLRQRYSRLLQMKKNKSYTSELQELMKEADKAVPKAESHKSQSVSGQTEKQVSAERDNNQSSPPPTLKESAAHCPPPVAKTSNVPQAPSSTDIPQLVHKIESNVRKSRKVRKRCVQDKDISLLFRSFFHQPKGRVKKAFFNHDTLEDMTSDACSLAQILHAKVDQSCKDRVMRRRDAEALMIVYRQMNSSEDFLIPKHYMPPCVTTMIGLRTLLLEERNLFRLCLQRDENFAMDQPRMLDKKEVSKKCGTSKDEVVAGTSKESGPFEPVAGPSKDTFEPVAGSSKDTFEQNNCAHCSPEEAFKLFRDRFLTVFLWPAVLSRIAPCQEYYGDLFEGTRMACASDNEMEDEEENSEMKAEAVEQYPLVAEMKVEVDTKPVRPLNKYERKQRLRTRWEKYRQQKLKDMQEAGITPQMLHKKDEEEKIAEAQRIKDSLVLRIPGKIGRPAQKRRTKKKAMDQIQEVSEIERTEVEVPNTEGPKSESF